MSCRVPPVFVMEPTDARVSLPIIRPIGSRRASQVFVMKPTHARDLRHPALARSLHSPMFGCVFSQG
jgi:hypothetical protein